MEFMKISNAFKLANCVAVVFVFCAIILITLPAETEAQMSLPMFMIGPMFFAGNEELTKRQRFHPGFIPGKARAHRAKFMRNHGAMGQDLIDSFSHGINPNDVLRHRRRLAPSSHHHTKSRNYHSHPRNSYNRQASPHRRSYSRQPSPSQAPYP